MKPEATHGANLDEIGSKIKEKDENLEESNKEQERRIGTILQASQQRINSSRCPNQGLPKRRCPRTDRLDPEAGQQQMSQSTPGPGKSHRREYIGTEQQTSSP
ncbi:hypothetical protein C922_05687 [Plasmodium inui San Antonio 1]|uniref:Uncharacterized protein n=1 Tax=Plasmodium inui San Antonio 1 TaxID=1237626 RepID=W7AF70_9APIC|nr:hypothetical protein C922_05687 [Plasmodium inui San Antonio 1]EUD63931.1 hypothetical protein C922_05687 [Plasmodium inui San Antonio 1]